MRALLVLPAVAFALLMSSGAALAVPPTTPRPAPPAQPIKEGVRAITMPTAAFPAKPAGEFPHLLDRCIDNNPIYMVYMQAEGTGPVQVISQTASTLAASAPGVIDTIESVMYEPAGVLLPIEIAGPKTAEPFFVFIKPLTGNAQSAQVELRGKENHCEELERKQREAEEANNQFLPLSAEPDWILKRSFMTTPGFLINIVLSGLWVFWFLRITKVSQEELDRRAADRDRGRRREDDQDRRGYEGDDYDDHDRGHQPRPGRFRSRHH